MHVYLFLIHIYNVFIYEPRDTRVRARFDVGTPYLRRLGSNEGPVRTPGSDAGPTDQEWPANVILRRLHEYAF